MNCKPATSSGTCHCDNDPGEGFIGDGDGDGDGDGVTWEIKEAAASRSTCSAFPPAFRPCVSIKIAERRSEASPAGTGGRQRCAIWEAQLPAGAIMRGVAESL